eukprot:4575393-Amphidinium_carterae.1
MVGVPSKMSRNFYYGLRLTGFLESVSCGPLKPSAVVCKVRTGVMAHKDEGLIGLAIGMSVAVGGTTIGAISGGWLNPAVLFGSWGRNSAPLHKTKTEKYDPSTILGWVGEAWATRKCHGNLQLLCRRSQMTQNLGNQDFYFDFAAWAMPCNLGPTCGASKEQKR